FDVTGVQTCALPIALAPFAVVGHLGLLVHRPPDPVTDVLLDHPVTVGAAHLVDGGTDVTEPAALSDLADAGPHALLGDLDELPGFRRDLADAHRERGVTMKSLVDGAGVHGQDVAFL